MSDFINGILNNCATWIDNLTNAAIGNGLIMLGSHIEGVAAIVIVLGILLWICRNTKVFRYGCISYGIGLLIELIGSVMIK